jgi:hypothetical protein
MTRKSTKLRIWITSLAAIFIATIYLAKKGNFSANSLRSYDTKEHAQSSHEAEREENRVPANKTGPAAERRISAEQQKVIHDRQQRFEASLQRVEIANTAVVYDRDWPVSQQVVMRVLPPSSEQLNQIYTDLSQAVKEMPPDSAAEEKIRETLLKLVFDYFTYPKSTKMLSVIFKKDENRVIEIAEYFVDDEALFVFKSNGDISYPPGDRSIFRLESNFGDPRSWVTKRYSHLIEIESNDSDPESSRDREPTLRNQ